VTAEASLAVLRDGLRTYVNGRLATELMPLIRDAANGRPELALYLDEVLLSTLRTVVDTVFDTVLDWRSVGGDTQRALRELCSSLLMRLFGRSLVVTGDVILAHALGLLQQQLRDFAANANRAGGIAPMLAGLTGLDRDLVADLVTETLEVCAETFGPMPDDRRARMRDLMYQMIDTTPPAADASTLESLKAAGMVGNGEAAFELARLLGEEIAGNLVRFVGALLTRIASTLLALVQEMIADIQHAVDVWVGQIEALAAQLLGQLGDLLREIGRLQHEVDVAVDAMLAQASALLGGFAGHGGSRSALRTKLKNAMADRALDVLAKFPGYGALPGDVRRGIRDTVRHEVDHLLDDDIFNPVLGALDALAGETAELLDDLRAIVPGDDLAVAIADIALDHIEDALRIAFGGDPGLRIRVDAPVLGEINLGTVQVPIGSFITVARGAIRALGRFNAAVIGAVGAFTAMLEAESNIAAAQAEDEATQAIKNEADDRIAETRDGALDLAIVQPQPASAITGVVTLRLRIPGGSAAMLSGDGLSQRRLFVWVNDTELPLDGAHTEIELPLALRTLPDLPGTRPPAKPGAGPAPTRGNPLARARAQRHDQQHFERLTLRATHPASPSPWPPGAGGVARFAGKPLPLLAHAGFPPRIPVLPVIPVGDLGTKPALIVTLDVPSTLLHEGINAIACTLVPGAAARRVERSVSFLHVPGTPDDPAVPTMPHGRILARLPAALAEILQRRGAATAAPALVPEALREVRRATWVPPLAARKKGISAARKQLQKELAATAATHAAIGEAIAKRTLRPSVPQPAPIRKRKEKAK